jgi:alpha/beta superfamily hydrolase
MRSEKLSFKNSEGHTLSAKLDLPLDGKPLAYALFAHCFTCTKNLKAVGNINRALTAASIAVLRFDFTGLGESEGDFADTAFSSNVADLIAAADFLKQRYQAPKILIGHSFGGAAVLHATTSIPSAAAVATIAAPFEPGHVAHLLGSSRQEIEAKGEAVVSLAGRPFRIKRQFLEDLERSDPNTVLRNLRRPLLVLHSPLDDTVGIDNAMEIFMAARHPKSFISLDRADHLLTDSADSMFAGTMIAAWAERYIGVAEQPKTL